MADAPVVPPTTVEVLVGDYRRYLMSDRSVAPLTLPSYLASETWFLAEACGDDGDRVAGLSAQGARRLGLSGQSGAVVGRGRRGSRPACSTPRDRASRP